MYGIILGAIGSMASILALVLQLYKEKKQHKLTFLLVLILILTCSSSYLSYKYYETTQPERIRMKKQESLSESAKSFIDTYPSFRSYWDAGENEGIAKSGLLILEMHQDLFPETYIQIKNDLEEDLKFGREFRNQEEQRFTSQTSAKQIYNILKLFSEK